jgi:hypothetical protein
MSKLMTVLMPVISIPRDARSVASKEVNLQIISKILERFKTLHEKAWVESRYGKGILGCVRFP